ncbi:MAG: hypothetical protein LBP20_07630 [Treponema sp.]|nr:hypothetical protein [Treponema sp.]
MKTTIVIVDGLGGNIGVQFITLKTGANRTNRGLAAGNWIMFRTNTR